MISKPNYNRMMNLIDEVFSTRKDPGQIQVTSNQMKKLMQIHPDCLTEFADEQGPLIWILIIPTTTLVMEKFLKGGITEKEILDQTPIGVPYESLYLCSVTTLPELRHQGKTKQMCLNVIEKMQKNNHIKNLFVWPFTKAGEALAKSLANASSLSLLIK